jgi:glycosyltransferase involved in cell wall biosynthesis
MTTRNDGRTIEASFDSLLPQLDESFELIVVDGGSDDARQSAFLASLSGRARHLGNPIRTEVLCMGRISRGKARQIAFEHSRGDYVLSSIDTDDTFRPVLKEMLSQYHARFEGKIVSFGGLTVLPRTLVKELGGWPDLQWNEDGYLYARAFRRGLYVADFSNPFWKERGFHEQRHSRFWSKYYWSREKWRIGVNPLTLVRRSNSRHKTLYYMICTLAYVGALFKPRYERIGTEEYIKLLGVVVI